MVLLLDSQDLDSCLNAFIRQSFYIILVSKAELYDILLGSLRYYCKWRGIHGEQTLGNGVV